VRLGRAAAAALVLLLAASVSASVDAQQLDFKRVTRGDELLSYRWRDSGKHVRTVSFTLTRQAIREAESSFAEFSLEAMWRVIERDLQEEVERFGDGAEIEIRRAGDGLRWKLQAPDQKTLDQLNPLIQERLGKSQQAYLSRYLRRTASGKRIVVDFAAATRALQSPLRAVARALGEVRDVPNDERARIALALGFFQEIPYATLEDKHRQGGDFLPAPALLAQNRGDCDSKAVALAAVLRTFTRLRKLAVVTMPDHAILAVEMPAEPGDTTIRQGGRQYVALEPAGPLMAPVGRVSPNTAKYLGGPARDIEIWPLD
jgi:hypothetical protein